MNIAHVTQSPLFIFMQKYRMPTSLYMNYSIKQIKLCIIFFLLCCRGNATWKKNDHLPKSKNLKIWYCKISSFKWYQIQVVPAWGEPNQKLSLLLGVGFQTINCTYMKKRYTYCNTVHLHSEIKNFLCITVSLEIVKWVKNLFSE